MSWKPHNKTHTMAKMVAKAIFYASIQASIGSVEMSSKFSVMNFSKDQETLQRAADALNSYILIGTVWTLGTMLALYASYDLMGALVGFLANAVMMGWIFASYIHAFKLAAKNYDLEEPVMFKNGELKMIAVVLLLGLGGFGLLRKYAGNS